jgi:hypothetical protein
MKLLTPHLRSLRLDESEFVCDLYDRVGVAPITEGERDQREQRE